MRIREMVLREKEIEERIEFIITELEMIEDLLAIPKYEGSETLEEKMIKLGKEVMDLLAEKVEVMATLDLLETVS